MKQSNKARDLKLADILIKAKASVNIYHKGKDGGEWPHDKWLVKVTRGQYETRFDYSTGIGHRKGGMAKTPALFDVLECLLMDEGLGNDTFEDFCANCGYDTDSRKALEIYLSCQEAGKKLRKAFGHDAVREIMQLVEEENA